MITENRISFTDRQKTAIIFSVLTLALSCTPPPGLCAQARPMPLSLEGDPALARILVWQLDKGETADAERLLSANMGAIKDRLEEVVRETDREFDIIGRFGAVSIRFGPGYGELGAKNRSYQKLFDLYKKLGGDENLYKRFEARRLRVEGAHLTNQGENACGETADWDGSQKLYQEALQRLNSAFALAQQVGDYRLMASAKINIGSALIRLGRPEEAIKAYNEASRSAERAPGDLYKGLVRLNLGNTYVWRGDPERSLSYSQEALAIFRKIGRGTWEANALMNIGNAYIRERRFADAWETLHLALEVARKHGEYRVYGRTLINMGMAGIQLNRSDAASLLQEALQWYKDDTEIYPAIEREMMHQDGLRMLSQLARQSGNQALAEKYDREFWESMGSDPNRYKTLRESPCFSIYQARPKQNTASIQ
ncbi:MAG: tetratricopeptide repeat protein [Acidobacteria bacterium]|nr:tetratricopeptide repeat protein [Acidobacteriota bacterium]